MLSVCMIVKNEARNLPHILVSIRGVADEIIVVDTGSTDETKEIAKSAGTRVFDFEWCDDFSAARNYSLSQATGHMILWLDADDRINPASKAAMLRELKTIERKMYFCRVKNTNGPEFLQLRMFPNDKRIHFDGIVHEAIFDMCGYEPVEFASDFVIHHTGYERRHVAMAKLERNYKLLRNTARTHVSLFAMANTLVAMKMFEEAGSAFIETVGMLENNDIQPDIHYAAIIGAAQCMLETGNRLEAVSYAERAVSLRPFDIRGWYFLGKSSNNIEAYGRGLQCRNYLSSLQNFHEFYHVKCLIESNLITNGVRV